MQKSVLSDVCLGLRLFIFFHLYLSSYALLYYSLFIAVHR